MINMKLIPLTQNQFAQVDDHWFDYLMQWSWRAYWHRHTYYAIRSGKGCVIQMHRVIMSTPDDLIVDHKDHDGLNNLEENMRNCTNSQNKMNVIPTSNTGYLGVYFQRNLIRAKIRVEGKAIHIGVFKSVEDAARAYDERAKEYFGEYANLNFK